MTDIQKIIHEWFGDLDADGCASKDKAQRWWTKDPTFDEYLRSNYGQLVERAIDGELEDWRDTPTGSLALVLLLDQFTRNIFRDSGRMFSGDEHALEIAKSEVESGRDEQLPFMYRAFLYMPFMHSEALADQERCIELFAGCAQQSQGAVQSTLQNNHKFAVAHRDIVSRFGRFPHRNALLGRDTTPEEAEFLSQPGSSF